MEMKFILIGIAIICFAVMAKSLLDIRSITRSMSATTARMIRRCDSMIETCGHMAKISKRLINKGRR